MAGRLKEDVVSKLHRGGQLVGAGVPYLHKLASPHALLGSLHSLL